MRALNILHVLRAPVGGLFRHVLDLARGQAARGHAVGIIADSSSGGDDAAAAFAALAPVLKFGITRLPMSRHVGPHDIAAIRRVSEKASGTGANVLHGHGAKGGAYARLAHGNALRVYTPHGGSLHYSPSSLLGVLYLGAERWMERRTDLFLFESQYSADLFRHKIATPSGLVRVVHNGVAEADFAPISHTADASDLVFVGELRLVKGIAVLIDAIAALARGGRQVTATIVGEGPDGGELRAHVLARGLADTVHFVGAMPAREGFRRGRLLIVPSLHESLPYIVLEAGAAAIPMLATRVGGIPEIFGPEAGRLVPASDPAALARAITAALDDPEDSRTAAMRLREKVWSAFSAAAMVDGALAAYVDGLKAQGKVNG